ncbi:LysR family transcriptional regulator [Bacillus alkalicellulosilyticus]|uniref:LysR family transcriptional regulator n=1 Tax=Alkalihalobacterium alkalicellulosilyticum TaxID=1912214 RepID=UPI000995FC25|nr:LysR family transcriptional regulator [Bacillus alkalicellulosilyticus]
MEIRQLRYFMEVAKREHVTDAADYLHVAQSAVSRQIVNLESELGVDLFVRQGRSVRLTPIGRMFLERTKEAMKMLDNAKREVEEHLQPEHGTIRITYPISMAAYTLPTAISAFRLKYPHARFQLKQGTYHQLLEDVVNGDYNIALLGPVPLNDDRLKGHILFTENITALLPISHPLANEVSLTLEQLKDEPFILLPKESEFRNIVVRACNKAGFEPKVSFEGDDIDALKGLVSASLGITLLPEITLVENLPRATVKIPVDDPHLTRTIGLITPSDRKLLPTERLFYEFLKAFLGFDRLIK